MTTITIDRALLEQALEALDNIPHPPWRDKELADAIRAELAKPSATPAWHDAPTEPGLWAPPSGVVLNVTQTDLEHWEHVTTQCAWYGPIPEDEHDKSRWHYKIQNIKVRPHNINRDDPVQVVEELGEACNTPYARLKIVEIPDDVEWHINEEAGIEGVAENHRTWH